MNKLLDSQKKKSILIELLNKGDPKRKQKIFELYQAYFYENYSTQFLVDLINKDLGVGKNLINSVDIKYIKSKILKKQKKQLNNLIEVGKVQSNIQTSNNSASINSINISQIDFKEQLKLPKSLD